MVHNLAASVMAGVAIVATIFLPSIYNGQRDWFTTQDVVEWSERTGNVMPIYCTENLQGVFTSCTVVQAQPLTLVWDNETNQVVAR